MPSHPAMAPPATWLWQRPQLASAPFCPQQGQSCLIHAPTHPLPTGPQPHPAQALLPPALACSHCPLLLSQPPTCPLEAPLPQGRQGLCEMQTWHADCPGSAFKPRLGAWARCTGPCRPFRTRPGLSPCSRLRGTPDSQLRGASVHTALPPERSPPPGCVAPSLISAPHQPPPLGSTAPNHQGRPRLD